jgi:hypothetical protein
MDPDKLRTVPISFIAQPVIVLPSWIRPLAPVLDLLLTSTLHTCQMVRSGQPTGVLIPVV